MPAAHCNDAQAFPKRGFANVLLLNMTSALFRDRLTHAWAMDMDPRAVYQDHP